MDQQGKVTFSLSGEPVVTGADSGISTSKLSYTAIPPPWCAKYLRSKKAWTKPNCGTASKVTLGQALDNIDGVICTCYGSKVVEEKTVPHRAGFQRISAVRGKGVGNDRYQSYLMQMTAPVGGSPAPNSGMEFLFTFERKSPGPSSKIVKRTVKVIFTHVLEYQDRYSGGVGFSEGTDRSGSGRRPGSGSSDGTFCAKDFAINMQKQSASCVVQEFFLDNFKPVKYVDTGTDHVVTFGSDVLGTTPWAPAVNGTVSHKPYVSFEVFFGKSAQGTPSATNFETTEVLLGVANFPYKFKNSSLSLRVTLISDDPPGSSVNEGDMTFSPSALDHLKGCHTANHDKLNTGCPAFNLEEKLKMAWAKTVTDGANSTGTFKVVTTNPVKQGGATGYKTGFSMQQAYYLRWEMGFNMLNLPDSLHSGVGTSVAPSILALAVVALALWY